MQKFVRSCTARNARQLVPRHMPVPSLASLIPLLPPPPFHLSFKDCHSPFPRFHLRLDQRPKTLLTKVVDVNLVRDKKTGKSMGFAFLAYEDQRSTTLAVDNISGFKLLGRTLKVRAVYFFATYDCVPLSMELFLRADPWSSHQTPRSLCSSSAQNPPRDILTC